MLRLQELGDTTALPRLFFSRDDLAVRLENVAGVEIEDWPAQIASAALRLVDHQANMAMEAALGKAPETLPLDTITLIHTGNALRMEWADVMPPAPGVMVVGNPPFLGHATRTTEQAQELRDVWNTQRIGRLDYVTGWFKKALDYLGDTPGTRFAFVSTNSITQGEPVHTLFAPIFEAGWRIRFAHQTFAWTSEVPGAAAVHCVITGFDREPRTPARLFTYETPQSEPYQVPVAGQINAYLADGPHVLIDQRRHPLSPLLPPAVFGNMPRDGGNLLVEPGDYDEVRADQYAAKYLRRYLGAKELISHIDRWCLWLVDFDPSDIAASSLLRRRLALVREFRSASSAASTRQMAETPHLFGQRSHRDVPHVVVPGVSSELRKYATVEFVGPDVISSNAVFTIEDPYGFAFAILSSSMFITWQRTVGGRLKSDLRFSNTLVWNNLPLPEVGETLRERIIEAGRGVLQARALHPDRSLAEHYNPLAMDPALLKAHAALDRVVDKAFGAKKVLASNEERLPVLFERYAELTGALDA